MKKNLEIFFNIVQQKTQFLFRFHFRTKVKGEFYWVGSELGSGMFFEGRIRIRLNSNQIHNPAAQSVGHSYYLVSQNLPQIFTASS